MYCVTCKPNIFPRLFPIIEFELTVTEVKLLQFQKAPSPMLVTLLGMVTEVKLLQVLKALPPMLVTLLGIVTEVKPEQL